MFAPSFLVREITFRHTHYQAFFFFLSEDDSAGSFFTAEKLKAPFSPGFAKGARYAPSPLTLGHLRT